MSEAQAATAPAKSTADEPWPVRVVTQKISAWIAKLGWVWVDGQVAQISRRAGSGVVFLTLRDPAADLSLSVTVHRDVLETGAPDLSEGARVTLHAKPEFYQARGSLSLRADEIRQVGLGELLARLERLKKLLAAEGLFARERKRRLPFLPGRIGLITGQNTAAERDVLTNVHRRWPGADFRVAHVAVQGPNAVPQIINALKVLDDDETVDVIVIARGGGSVEDLLPFSDEALCRQVFAARTPVVSAIGHETDTPLLDYVADLRASTPTDAAKRIVPDLADEIRLIDHARQRLDRAVLTRIDRERQRVEALRSRPVLARPETLIDQRAAEVVALRDRAGRSLEHRVRRADDELRHTLARLRALSPLATLQRGYAIVQRGDGHVLRAAGEVDEGDPVRVRLAEGELTAVVTSGENA
ncbi:exodeoxyribonuclease VII large subunit [Actinoplanes sp. SE50]|uniref:exodeoxyribonuclease VII large subunit n=1 Tax=unclassified Actinoplanes TaxID=2626549 RepID=UPI00023EDD33|nr:MULTISPECIES: exodeoxyribonuclease VII large subunit [unclassified Actinoplanes]AEV88581.1 exodeoxyribonuclease VII large subunit [Actinoplanes sp. SE50/110]ATO86986.1 exodeoxyribonuclease VII large subunit [Actinoplanes sp. SE50]SLM04404.1 exodeoxyribonuclease VII large subunit [Actinoplanes sp. SE50/110]